MRLAKATFAQSSVVYMATCTLCKDRYIGMTARRLHDRALEHLRAIKNGSSSSALADHYATKHEGKPANVTFSILKHVHNHDVLRLHIEEAIAIKKYCPELNRSCTGTNWHRLSSLTTLHTSFHSFFFPSHISQLPQTFHMFQTSH